MFALVRVAGGEGTVINVVVIGNVSCSFSCLSNDGVRVSAAISNLL